MLDLRGTRNKKGALFGLKGVIRELNPKKGNKGLLWVLVCQGFSGVRTRVKGVGFGECGSGFWTCFRAL